MASWWVVTYVAQGTGAAQLGTVIVQAASSGAARTAAGKLLPSGDQVGAARGPYASQQDAANGGVATSGPQTGGTVTPTSGTAPAGTAPPSGNGQVSATASNLNTSSACLISLPVVGCIFQKTQARALIAGIVIGASGIVALVGLAFLTIEAASRSGAADAAGKGLEHVGAGLAFVPGLEPAGLAVGGAGMVARRGSSGAGRSLERRRQDRSRRSSAQQSAATAQQRAADRSTAETRAAEEELGARNEMRTTGRTRPEVRARRTVEGRRIDRE